MIVGFAGFTPRIHSSALIAAGAQIIGQVEIGAESSIWYNCVLRGDVNLIRIGERSNIQDGSVIHCDSADGDYPGLPTLIGDEVLVGHMAMLHGCTLHDRAFVGLGSIVMDRCEIEPHGMLAAGALLTPGKAIRERQLWAGRPARFVRDLSDEEVESQLWAVDHYVDLAAEHREALRMRASQLGSANIRDER